MIKLIWENFILSIFGAFFGALVTVVVSGNHIGNTGYFFNVFLLTAIFTIIDLRKQRKKAKE